MKKFCNDILLDKTIDCFLWKMKEPHTSVLNAASPTQICMGELRWVIDQTKAGLSKRTVPRMNCYPARSILVITG